MIESAKDRHFNGEIAYGYANLNERTENTSPKEFVCNLSHDKIVMISLFVIHDNVYK